jgi:RNA polymerase sigma factor (TIGR02999 family)
MLAMIADYTVPTCDFADSPTTTLPHKTETRNPTARIDHSKESDLRSPEINREIGIPNAGATNGRKAASDLLPFVYEELRRLAASKLAREAPGQTLQTTALVHEAWLSLVGNGDSHWQNQSHFLAAAADAMRHILIDRARRKNRLRHGKGLTRVNLEHVDLATESDDDTLLRVDEALTKFAAEDPVKAQLIKLRYFVGLSIPEAAAAIGMSESTAKRAWAYARAWLYDELKEDLTRSEPKERLSS